MIRNWVTSVIQVNTGAASFSSRAPQVQDGDDEVEPGGERRDAEDLQASIQKSMFGPGEYCRSVRLA